jgi:hypothetical protein
LTNINLYNYLPSQKPFYFYNASYKNSRSNYIIFPEQSCNVTISYEDYEKLWEITKNSPTNPIQNPNNDYYKLFKRINPVYYNEIGANISNNNDYYLDCRVADYEEKEDVPQEDSSFTTQFPSNSIYNMIVFIAIAVVCMLLYLLVINIPKFIK